MLYTRYFVTKEFVTEIMANALPTFQQFDIHSDENSVGIRWTKYVQKLENMFVGMSVESKKRRKALLLHYSGDEVFEIHDTLPNTGGDSDYDQTKQALETYFKPKVNEEFEIYEFRQLRQLESETVDQFATKLRQKASNCAFSNTDGEIKSQIIQGCISTELRRKALKDSMNLEQLLLAARTMEISNRQAHKMATDLRQHEQTNAIRKKPSKPAFLRPSDRPVWRPSFNAAKSTSSGKQTSVCRKCGGVYPHQNGCPAYGKTCNYCKKPNHFVTQCLKRKRTTTKVKQIEKTADDSENEADSENEVDYSFGVATNSVNTKRPSPKTKVKINDHETNVLVDTGSSINILDESVYLDMKNKPVLSKADTKAFAYGQKNQLPMKGKFQATIETDKKITTGNFYVISGNFGSLLSYNTAVDLNIIPVINAVGSSKTDQLLHEYSDLFCGLGQLKNKTVKLHIDESVPAVALPTQTYTVPCSETS